MDLKNENINDYNVEALKSDEKRVKTSLRMNYEAQVEVIKTQIGDLEQIRNNLGLSQRKMTQLLLVDPSSWSRWTQKGGKAPPHIYRALQWYMTIQEKIPGLNANYFLQKDSENIKREMINQTQEIKKSVTDLQNENDIKIQNLKQTLNSEWELRLQKIIENSFNESQQLENEIFDLKQRLYDSQVGFNKARSYLLFQTLIILLAILILFYFVFAH